MCDICEQYKVGYITLQQLFNAIKPELDGTAPKQLHDVYIMEEINEALNNSEIDQQGNWNGTEPDGSPSI